MCFRSNLDPKCDMADEQLWEALEMVQLKEFISKLGRGLGEFSAGR